MAPLQTPNVDIDIEQSPQVGYPAYGDFLAADPDNETLIFCKFDRLATRNLLALQSEVKALEAESRALDREICLSDQKVLASMARWESLIEEANKDRTSIEARYIDLTLRIRAKLKEYRM